MTIATAMLGTMAMAVLVAMAMLAAMAMAMATAMPVAMATQEAMAMPVATALLAPWPGCEHGKAFLCLRRLRPARNVVNVNVFQICAQRLPI